MIWYMLNTNKKMKSKKRQLTAVLVAVMVNIAGIPNEPNCLQRIGDKFEDEKNS